MDIFFEHFDNCPQSNNEFTHQNTSSRWWFQTFFIFTPAWGDDPIWLIFFKWVETTNYIAHVWKFFFSMNMVSRWQAKRVEMLRLDGGGLVQQIHFLKLFDFYWFVSLVLLMLQCCTSKISNQVSPIFLYVCWKCNPVTWGSTWWSVGIRRFAESTFGAGVIERRHPMCQGRWWEKITMTFTWHLYMFWVLSSHCFYVIGDSHQPNSTGVYTHYKDSLSRVGWPFPI